MEDTQNQTPQQPTEQPVTQPAQPNNAAPTQPVAPNQPKSSRSFTIALIVVVLLIVAVITFVFLSRRTEPATLNPGPVQITPTIEVSPTTASSAEEQEVEQVDVTDTVPTDIPPVKNEIQGL